MSFPLFVIVWSCHVNIFTVWQDMRTSSLIEELTKKLPNNDKNNLAPKNGLPLSPYFSATKIYWLLRNVPEVKVALDEGRLLVGTIDSWLIWVRLSLRFPAFFV